MKTKPDVPDVFQKFIGAAIAFEEKTYKTNLGPGHRLRFVYKVVETDPVLDSLRQVAAEHYPEQRLTLWVPQSNAKPISRNPHIKVIMKSIKTIETEPKPQLPQEKITRKFAISRIIFG